MTEDELEEYNTELRLYAGISLPGVIGKMSIFATPDMISKEAFDIAEAMMKEAKNREPKLEEK